MTRKKSGDAAIYRLVVTALMAALVYVGTLIRIPLGASKVHCANAISVFAGFILQPVDAGLAAGLGSAIYDLTLGGYGILDAVVTFVTKFAIGWVAGILFRLAKKKLAGGGELEGVHTPLIYVISALAALSYTALYMLKSLLWPLIGLVPRTKLDLDGGRTLLSGAGIYMLSKLPASLINAAVSAFLAPFLYWTVRPALVKTGVIAKLNAK